jgi:hypothetical protein
MAFFDCSIGDSGGVECGDVKILGLVSSDAHGGKGNIPKEDLYPAAMQAPLAKAIGEEVEVVARALWPNPGVDRVVARWIEEVQPDMVLFAVSSFWFLYESTPVRIERKLGTPGRLISQGSQKVAATPWLAHNRAFQWGRKQAQRTVGGSAWFEPDEVIARSTDIIREVIRHEGSYLVVSGPGGGERWAQTEEQRNRSEARRDTVDHALASLCAKHHIEYWGKEKWAPLRDPGKASLQGDQLHLDREGHKRVAERYFDVSLGWVQRAKEARDAGGNESPGG